jgi:hypothetical protein
MLASYWSTVHPLASGRRHRPMHWSTDCSWKQLVVTFVSRVFRYIAVILLAPEILMTTVKCSNCLFQLFVVGVVMINSSRWNLWSRTCSVSLGRSAACICVFASTERYECVTDKLISTYYAWSLMPFRVQSGLHLTFVPFSLYSVRCLKSSTRSWRLYCHAFSRAS